MKKILTIMIAAALVLSMAACSSKPASDPNVPGESETVGSVVETPAPESENEVEETEKPESSKAPEKTPEASKTPEETKKPEAPEETKKPEKTPAVETPAPTPQAPKTVGNTLLAAFKANSGGSALSVAERLSANPAIKVPVGAMSVEEGYLTGFDNTEIKGFKEGAVFMPMIGTIPFVGYVFTLENASDAPAFIANLKSAANLRWNICTSADEMVTGSAGNKVFFVMCPTAFEE
ncbi:MAG: hypothetical protein IKB55_05025 [Clostridia bacterium]|nr:hypothetical protein [Clostridia bacterium]